MYLYPCAPHLLFPQVACTFPLPSLPFFTCLLLSLYFPNFLLTPSSPCGPDISFNEGELRRARNSKRTILTIQNRMKKPRASSLAPTLKKTRRMNLLDPQMELRRPRRRRRSKRTIPTSQKRIPTLNKTQRMHLPNPTMDLRRAWRSKAATTQKGTMVQKRPPSSIRQASS